MNKFEENFVKAVAKMRQIQIAYHQETDRMKKSKLVHDAKSQEGTVDYMLKKLLESISERKNETD